MQLFSYLCVNYVVLDLLLCDGDVLQDHLQPHRHHAGHPVHQAGADVAGHPPLEQQEKNTAFILQVQQFFYSVFCLSLEIVKTFSSLCFISSSLM